MWSLYRVLLTVVLIASMTLLAVCGGSPKPSSPTQAAATSPPLVPPTQATAGAVNVLLSTPQPAPTAEPLLGKIPDIPNVFIVAARQSKASLATFLKTTPAQLDWVNPGLPDSVTPGTLVVVPPIYRTSGETLSEVSQKTGLPERQLRAANPQLGGIQALPSGTVLAVPALFIVPENMPLSGAANRLETTRDALLSANPELAGREEIAAGRVLVVPLEREGQP